MSSANGHAKRTEKGLLTQDNCVVALIDHQPQRLFGTLYPDWTETCGVEYAYTMVHKAPPTVFPEYVVPSDANHR